MEADALGNPVAIPLTQGQASHLGHLKQFRAIATRDDKLASTFLAAVQFVAAASLLK